MYSTKKEWGENMKIKKKILKKLIFVLSLAIVLTSCYFIMAGQNVWATTASDPFMEEASKPAAGGAISADADESEEGSGGGMISEETSKDSMMVNGLKTIMTGLVSLLLYPIQLLILLIGWLMKILMNACASLATGGLESVSVEHILFAGYQDPDGKFGSIDFMDVNFFNMSTGNSTIDTFRGAVAQWYYIMRLISAAILLVILIYVGIRMALATVASEQAKYKQMLTDWATSLALLFVLHYIVIFVVAINTSLVSALGGLLKGTMVDSGTKTIGEFLNTELVKDIWTPGFTGIIAAIMYCFLQGQAFRYFLFYMKRMITVGFLIIIAPLITITYSIDKMGDGKAQALNAWLKEITYNILIQPFHCVIYLAFFGAIATMLVNAHNWSISVYVIAYAVLKFMKTAEELLRKIFHFEANSMPAMGAPAKDFMNATGKFAQMGMATAKSVSYFKNAGGMKALTSGFRKGEAKVGEFASERKVNKEVKKELKENYGTRKERKQAFEDYKKSDEYRERVNTTAADMKREADRKRTQKARKIYNKKHGGDAYAYDDMIEQKTKEAYDAKFGPGKYDEVLRTSKKRDANGNPTAAAQRAQAILDKQRGLARDKENSSIIANSNAAKRAMHKGGEVGGKAIKGISRVSNRVYRLSQTEGGKALGAYLKDTLAFTSTVATAAFGYGMTDDLGSAKMISDLLGGKGLTGGILERVSDTTAKDTAQFVNQLAAVNGWSQEEAMANTNNQLNLANAESASGRYKTLGDDQKALIKDLTELFDDNKKAASSFITQIKLAIANGDNLDMHDIVNRLVLSDNVTDENKEEAINISKEFTNLFIRSQIASQNAVAKEAGYEVDTFSRQVEKRVNIYETNNYAYNYDIEYENRPTQNPPPEPQPGQQQGQGAGPGGGPRPNPNL